MTSARLTARSSGMVVNPADHMLRKLQMSGRVQIATWAVANGLHQP